MIRMSRSNVRVGEKVGVILRIEEKLKIMYVAGFGTYEGSFHRPDAPTFAELEKDPSISKEGTTKQQRKIFYENSERWKAGRTRLDNGQYVWRHQVRWNPEEAYQNEIDQFKALGYTIALVNDTDAWYKGKKDITILSHPE